MENFKCTQTEKYEELSKHAPPSPNSPQRRAWVLSPSHSLLGLDYFGANVGHHLVTSKIFQNISQKMQRLTHG